MINGVINVRKEKGMTSFGVVSRMRRIFDQKKIGHTGTLDPDATGVLPVCVGKATKLAAAQICMDAGTDMVIVNGADPAAIYDVLDGKNIGTRFIGRREK